MSGAAALVAGDPGEVGGYVLVGRLGEGGQGVVYLGRSPSGRQVAVKLLSAGFSGDEAARVRFVRELETARRVADFCTARVIAADVYGDRPYIVSEYVRGRSLHELIRADGVRAGADLHRLAIGTVTALAAIHRAGIVHRDFKPPNVIVGEDGPRVIDFGIARALDGMATMRSHTVGTPAYMAPEQVAGLPLGPATDMFAWASTLVFAATGAPPFGADSIPAVLHRVLHAEPDVSALPPELAGIVRACLAKDPELRPTAAQTLMRLLGYPDTAPEASAPRVERVTTTLEVPAPDAGRATGPGSGVVLRGRKAVLVGALARTVLRLLIGVVMLAGAVSGTANNADGSLVVVLGALGIYLVVTGLGRLVPRIRAVREPFELRVDGDGLGVRDSGRLTFYRWPEIGRVAVRRTVPGKKWAVCVATVPGVPSPALAGSLAPLPHAEPKTGWIVLAPVSLLAIKRRPLEVLLADRSGPRWGGNN
ncbi:serine/threonine-protein kinase [Actinocorallia sp. A-T 12471]|uniref:serine/threonine-protein kinase n=1 Tax=Actinocorallia sp. A-T 12471 TaxID=3089813 RepID=UPI0029D016DB|nr:serine/threonine-protein kinase [Actinocorallia sp. A-T 12471]MDX6743013.1 serine/threonine-protein kinase [Actinocorallia sp. A-T 12471]